MMSYFNFFKSLLTVKPSDNNPAKSTTKAEAPKLVTPSNKVRGFICFYK
jgi:hypothetical protein